MGSQSGRVGVGRSDGDGSRPGLGGSMAGMGGGGEAQDTAKGSQHNQGPHHITKQHNRELETLNNTHHESATPHLTKLYQTNTTLYPKLGRCQMMTLLSSGDVTAVEGGHVRVGPSLKTTVPSSLTARPLSSHRDTR
ncbi:hypothetical protein Pcinc_029097 [Petrolisthes cinctipes]|uniref:Uncharacterized protein n=1 Tax=Petrolisthes cinctipes TaxID=88211 RepID=A0AAE1F0T8_PETCI|nr:hypothetical protein Pcinc_029097 [Petrolisthes cinctipes]